MHYNITHYLPHKIRETACGIYWKYEWEYMDINQDYSHDWAYVTCPECIDRQKEKIINAR